MTNVDRRRSYRPGGWFGIFGDNASVLLPPSEKHRVTALWELVDEGAGFDEVLDGLLATGLRELPGFVLVSEAAGLTKVVLRGAAVAAFVVDGDMVELAGNTDTTWVERSLVGVSQMFVQVEATDEEEGEDLLIENGLVRLGRVDQPPFRLEDADDAAIAAEETGESAPARGATETVDGDADHGVDPLGLGAAAAATGLGAGFAGGRLLGGDDDPPSAEAAKPEDEVEPAESEPEPEAESAESEPEDEVEPAESEPEPEAESAAEGEQEDAGAGEAEPESGHTEADGTDEAGEPAWEPADEAPEVDAEESPEAAESESPEGEEPAEERPSDEVVPDGSDQHSEESSDEPAEEPADDTVDETAGEESGDAVDEPSAEDEPAPLVSWASPPESEPEPESVPDSDEDGTAETEDDEAPAEAPGQEESGPDESDPEESGADEAPTDETPTEEAPAEVSAETDAEPSPWAPAAPSGEEPAEVLDDTGVDADAVDHASPAAEDAPEDEPSAAPSGGEAASNFGAAAPTYPPAAPLDDPLSAPLPGAVDEPDDHDGLTRGGWESAAAAPADATTAAAAAGAMATESGPVVARLLFSSGDEVDVDRPVLVGRAPEVRRFGGHDQPRLVPVPSPHQEISATHLEVRPGVGADHGSAVVTDLGSTNGTVLVQPGLPPEDLQPGIAVQLVPGAIIDLGDGVTIQVARV